MAQTVIDRILRERSIKNEKAVSIVGFGGFLTVSVLDFLSYLHLITFTSVTPTSLTVLLDSLFVLNMMRQSTAGTIYSGSLSIALFFGVSSRENPAASASTKF